MTLSTKIVKKIAFYSAILGAGLGITALIPPLMPVISLFILPFFIWNNCSFNGSKIKS